MRRTRMRQRERGYALFLAAIVVATLALVLLAAAGAQDALRPSARALQTRMTQAATAETLSARMAFTLLTEPIGARAVLVDGSRDAVAAGNERELRLDGRAYRAGDDIFVSVQDEAGLFDLNAPDEQALANLLANLNSSSAGNLAAALLDFTDADDLERNGGGEGRAYSRLGLQPPPNEALLNRWQALNALNWRRALSRDAREALWSSTTASARQRPLNVNTAPYEVLSAVAGDDAANALLQRREASALLDAAEIETLTSGQTRATGVALASTPGAVFRILVTFEDNQGVERRLALAGSGAELPFYWIEERRVNAWRRQDRGEQTEPVPYGAGLSAP